MDIELDGRIYRGLAPGIVPEAFNETFVFGAALWLCLHDRTHRPWPLQAAAASILPAIQTRQFALVMQADRPVFFASWARFSAAAEARYFRELQFDLSAGDWRSGERLWILEWLAPFGHARPMSQRFVKHWFAGECFRALRHRAPQRGQHLLQLHGAALSATQARAWFEAHPPVFAPHATQPESGA